MVTAKILKEYEFETIQEYYEYILLSIINGQRQQALNLIKVMSQKQKEQAIEHLEVYVSNQADECRKMIFRTL